MSFNAGENLVCSNDEAIISASKNDNNGKNWYKFEIYIFVIYMHFLTCSLQQWYLIYTLYGEKSPDIYDFNRISREILNVFFYNFGNIKNVFGLVLFDGYLSTKSMRGKHKIEEK